MKTEQASSSFTRALGLICSGVELRLVAEAYGDRGAPTPYAQLAADDFASGYATMEDALALKV